jgi:hypothetical protein
MGTDSLPVRLEAPCPCGSGRKYKRCCWARERQQAATARRAVQEAGPRLFEWAASAFPDEFEACTKAFLAHGLESFGEAKLGSFLSRTREHVYPNIADVFVHEWEVGDGLTPTDVYLARRGPALHPAARAYLAAAHEASLALVEVDDVTPGESILFHDLLSRRRLLVTEHTASRLVRRWQVMFARIAELPRENLLTGGIYELDRSHLEWVLATLRRDRARRGNRSLSWPEYLRKQWDIVPSMWLELYVDPLARLKLTNTDGEPLCWIELELQLEPAHAAAVEACLNGVSELRRDESATWRWIEHGDHEGAVVATVTLDGDSLAITVNSAERERRVRARIEAALGPLVLGARREETDLVEELRRRHDEGDRETDPEEDSVPPELAGPIERAARERHYRAWPDTRIPALDDLTPRQAAADPAMRPRLVRLLKTIELHEAEGGDAADGFAPHWLWRELGLKRP